MDEDAGERLMRALETAPEAHLPAHGNVYVFTAGDDPPPSAQWQTRVPAASPSVTIRCEGCLGEGGRAWVYACDASLDGERLAFESFPRLAVKVFRGEAHAECVREATLQARFGSEVDGGGRPVVARFLVAGSLEHLPTGRRLSAIVMEGSGGEDSGFRSLESIARDMKDRGECGSKEGVVRALRIAAAIARSLHRLSESCRAFHRGVPHEHGDIKPANVLISEPEGDRTVAVLLDHGSWHERGTRPFQFSEGVPSSDSAALAACLSSMLGEVPAGESHPEWDRAMVEVVRLGKPSGSLQRSARRLQKLADDLSRSATRRAVRWLGLAAAIVIVAVVGGYAYGEYAWMARSAEAKARFERNFAAYRDSCADADGVRLETSIRDIEALGRDRFSPLKRWFGSNALPSATELAQARLLRSAAGLLLETGDRRQGAAAAQDLYRERRERIPESLGVHAERGLQDSLAADRSAIEEARRRLPGSDRTGALETRSILEPITLRSWDFREIAPLAWEVEVRNRDDASELVRRIAGESDLVEDLVAARIALEARTADRASSLSAVEGELGLVEESLRRIDERRDALLSALFASERAPARELVDETRKACDAVRGAMSLPEDAVAVERRDSLDRLRRFPARQAWIEPFRSLESWRVRALETLDRFRSGVPPIDDPETMLVELGPPPFDGRNPDSRRDSGPEAGIDRLRKALESLRRAIEALDGVDRGPGGVLRPADVDLTHLRVDPGMIPWPGLAVPVGRFRAAVQSMRDRIEAAAAMPDAGDARWSRLQDGLASWREALAPAGQIVPDQLASLELLERRIGRLVRLERARVGIDGGLGSATRPEDVEALRVLVPVPDAIAPPDGSLLSSRERALGEELDRLRAAIEDVSAGWRFLQECDADRSPTTERLERTREAMTRGARWNRELGRRLATLDGDMTASRALDAIEWRLGERSRWLQELEIEGDSPLLPSDPVEFPSSVTPRFAERRDRLSAERERLATQQDMIAATRRCIASIRLGRVNPADAADAGRVLAASTMPRNDECARLLRQAIMEWAVLEGPERPDPTEQQFRREVLAAFAAVEPLGLEFRQVLERQSERIARLAAVQREILEERDRIERFTLDEELAGGRERRTALRSRLRQAADPTDRWTARWSDRLDRDSWDLEDRLYDRCEILARVESPPDEAAAAVRAEWLASIRMSILADDRPQPMAAARRQELDEAFARAEGAARVAQRESIWRELKENFEWWIGARSKEPVRVLTVPQFLDACDRWSRQATGVRTGSGGCWGQETPERVAAVDQARTLVNGTWEIRCEAVRIVDDKGKQVGDSGVKDQLPDDPAFRFKASASGVEMFRSDCRLELNRSYPIGVWRARTQRSIELVPVWIRGEWEDLGFNTLLVDLKPPCGPFPARIDPTTAILGPSRRYEAFYRLPDGWKAVFELSISLPSDPDRTAVKALFSEAESREIAVPGASRGGKS